MGDLPQPQLAHLTGHVRPQQEGGHLQARKGVLTRNQTGRPLDLGPAASGTIRKCLPAVEGSRRTACGALSQCPS